jgi:hypothetical protein
MLMLKVMMMVMMMVTMTMTMTTTTTSMKMEKVISLDDPSNYSSKVEPVLHIPISHEKKNMSISHSYGK